MQQNIHPSHPSDERQIEQKIMLLYLIDKVDIPISHSQIVQFALEENYMNYYTVQEYLKEMEKIDYLDSAQDGNTTRYTITTDGLHALDIFSKHLPLHLRNRINKYVSENQNTVRQDYEITANHFYEHDTGEYITKCSVYDGDTMLMELTASVVSLEQALFICNNWKNDVGSVYAQIMDVLLSKQTPNSFDHFENTGETNETES